MTELFQQLVDDGKDAARAEITLLRAIAIHRVTRARNGAIALAIAYMLGVAASVTGLMTLAQGLAIRVGPVGAGLIVAGLALIVAFALLRFGIKRMAVMFGDEEEREALERGERRA